MISAQQQIQGYATRVALSWLSLAARLPSPDRIKFLETVGSKVAPMFNYRVNQAALALMRQGQSPQDALQSALSLEIMKVLTREHGMGEIVADKTATADWTATFSNVATGLTEVGTTVFDSIMQYRTAQFEQQTAEWQRDMQQAQLEHQREMELLAAQRAATQPTFTSPTAPLEASTVASPASDNTALYVAGGLGVAALLGFALLMRR